MTVTTTARDSHPRLAASIDEVVPGKIWLGNLSCALSTALLSKHSITHIISACSEYPSTGEHHLPIAVDDSEYADVLIHLPRACEFIDSALAQGGRVLVHCVMGVSRSTTVVAAYLMKTRHITSSEALSLIRQVRSCVRPNYGFLRQLDVFAQCDYKPSPEHRLYMSWKRRQEQHVTSFLNQMIDTIPIVPDQLFLSSDFPEDQRQAEALIVELGITHVLSIPPSTIPHLPDNIKHRRVAISGATQSELLVSLPECCAFIANANASGGVVLVHSALESRACIVVASYLMATSQLSTRAVCGQIEAALPLFQATANVKKHLELFEACEYQPTTEHPLVLSWAPTATLPTNSISMSMLSDTGVDIGAFERTLTNVAERSRSKSGQVAVAA